MILTSDDLTGNNFSIESSMMDLKRKQPPESEQSNTSDTQRRQRVLTLKELIPPKQLRRNSRGHQRVNSNSPHPPNGGDNGTDYGTNQDDVLDWSAVIERAKSHPQEARESYFGQTVSASHELCTPTTVVDATISHHSVGNCNPGTSLSASENAISTSEEKNIILYKPLHAMLKYDPPLSAVEAVLRAHPEAALDETFEGTALKIAAESKVSTMMVLRLLLVAEMAMRKKKLNELKCYSDDGDHHLDSNGEDPLAPNNIFVGHNPIRWIAEPHISRKTSALLLKWYPIGAFQRPRDDDGAPIGQLDEGNDSDMYAESPLIEILDDFASDQDDEESNGDEDEDVGIYDSGAEDGYDEPPNEGHDATAIRRRRTPAEREQLREERRWEKFLHILYATDTAIRQKEAKPPTSANEANASTSQPVVAVTSAASTTATAQSSPKPPFRPVHAWIRCITNPNIGLELCRPYGAWSVLRAMGQRIPSEFTARDESDGNRTAFQILAESPARDCRLCTEEIKDVVENIIDADYRSAHLPRNSDGRLIGHVALDNGWPCRDTFSRKTSATCA
jgi:hypothetical protein